MGLFPQCSYEKHFIIQYLKDLMIAGGESILRYGGGELFSPVCWYEGGNASEPNLMAKAAYQPS